MSITLVYINHIQLIPPKLTHLCHYEHLANKTPLSGRVFRAPLTSKPTSGLGSGKTFKHNSAAQALVMAAKNMGAAKILASSGH